ncbi:MAG: phosphatidylserine decarboxylase, partial [Fusobacteriaceae bacterium]
FFGGSSCVLLFEKDKINFDKDILENSKKGIETKVYMGEKIGESK